MQHWEEGVPASEEEEEAAAAAAAPGVAGLVHQQQQQQQSQNKAGGSHSSTATTTAGGACGHETPSETEMTEITGDGGNDVETLRHEAHEHSHPHEPSIVNDVRGQTRDTATLHAGNETSELLEAQASPHPQQQQQQQHEREHTASIDPSNPPVVPAPLSTPAVAVQNSTPSDPPQAPPQFVKPSTFLLRSVTSARPGSGGGGGVGGKEKTAGEVKTRAMTPAEKEQYDGLRAIRAFLKVRTSYDVLPLSYRLIVLDTSLLVKKSLNILIQCGIVSAPLWDSKTSTFAGLLTTSDFINVVQYYWRNPDALAQIDQFKLSSLRDIERQLGVTPLETVSTHPMEPLYEACKRMLQSRARRIPLVDVDDETQRDMVVSVITQYRLLKFICVNVKETQMLRTPLRDIPQMGTYHDLAIAYMDTPVIDVIQMLVNKSISSVPIVDRDGSVLNIFEAVDVIMLIKGGDYEDLNLSVGKVLEKRPDDFPGIYTCTLNDRLDTIYDTVRKSRVHRFVVIDEARQLKGLLSLSDILEYSLNSPLPDEQGEEGGVS